MTYYFDPHIHMVSRVTDDYKRSATEYQYPSGTVIGTELVPFNGAPLGVAVDPGPPR